MQIAILIFEHVTALEAVAPYEVLSRLAGSRVTFVGERVGPVRSATGQLALTADAVLEELPHPEIVVVPGGSGRHRHMANGSVHQWLRAATVTADWMVGVGDGSLILASAGVLRERKVAATTQTMRRELKSLGALPVDARLALDGTFATAVDGASALDLAHELARRISGTNPANFPARYFGPRSESGFSTSSTTPTSLSKEQQ